MPSILEQLPGHDLTPIEKVAAAVGHWASVTSGVQADEITDRGSNTIYIGLILDDTPISVTINVTGEW